MKTFVGHFVDSGQKEDKSGGTDIGNQHPYVDSKFEVTFSCTGISSQIRTKLRNWAVWTVRVGCHSLAV